jgi:sec-independent protein translocase protein TatA
MNWLSPTHMIVIAIVALLLFGNRLPEIARGLGRAINEFKRGLKEVGDDMNDKEVPGRKPDPDKLTPPGESRRESDKVSASAKEHD